MSRYEVHARIENGKLVFNVWNANSDGYECEISRPMNEKEVRQYLIKRNLLHLIADHTKEIDSRIGRAKEKGSSDPFLRPNESELTEPWVTKDPDYDDEEEEKDGGEDWRNDPTWQNYLKKVAEEDKTAKELIRQLQEEGFFDIED